MTVASAMATSRVMRTCDERPRRTVQASLNSDIPLGDPPVAAAVWIRAVPRGVPRRGLGGHSRQDVDEPTVGARGQHFVGSLVLSGLARTGPPAAPAAQQPAGAGRSNAAWASETSVAPTSVGTPWPAARASRAAANAARTRSSVARTAVWYSAQHAVAGFRSSHDASRSANTISVSTSDTLAWNALSLTQLALLRTCRRPDDPPNPCRSTQSA